MRIAIHWAVVVHFVVSATAFGGTNWPQFRGPRGDNVVTDSEFPSDWDQERNVQWTSKIPGRGWASPIIWNDRVFISTAIEGRGSADFRWQVHCLDLNTGKELWKQVAFQGPKRIGTHRDNTFASETPVTDGEHVYTYFGLTGLVCHDMDGKVVWQKEIPVQRMANNWGTSSSPVLHGGQLFLQVDSEDASYLVSFDSKSGQEQWRVPREEVSNWSNPFIWENRNRTELITIGKTIRSYEPMTGKVLWQLNMGGGRGVNAPVANRDMLFVANEERQDGGGTLFAVKTDASGDITPKSESSTSPGVAWSKPSAGVAMASPLLYEGYIYALDRRRGVASCYNAETGETAYSGTRIPGAAPFWASPWAHSGKVFCLDEAGTTHVLQSGGEFKVLDTNFIKDKFWSTVALAKGSIIMRGVDNVYCVRR